MPAVRLLLYFSPLYLKDGEPAGMSDIKTIYNVLAKNMPVYYGKYFHTFR